MIDNCAVVNDMFRINSNSFDAKLVSTRCEDRQACTIKHASGGCRNLLTKSKHKTGVVLAS